MIFWGILKYHSRYLSQIPLQTVLFSIPTEANRAMGQLESLAIAFNFLQARKTSRVQGAIAFGFACHWLKNWRKISKPTTLRSNRNGEMTFDSYLISAVLRFN